MSEEFKPLIADAIAGPLAPAAASRAFEMLMSGEASPGQIGAFLVAMRMRGETVD